MREQTIPEIPAAANGNATANPESPAAPGPAAGYVGRALRAAVPFLLLLGSAVFLLWFTGLLPALGGTAAAKDEKPPPRAPLPGVTLAPGVPHTLVVPEEVRTALGIRKGGTDLLAVARKPALMRPLVMPGSTALDPTRIRRVRARFAPSPSSAEVVEIGQVAESPMQSGKAETVFREIRSGDRVAKNDLLAVFHSVDVGNKKNDLIDAIYQLKLDEEILKAAEAKREVVPEVFLWNARRNVQGDVNAVNRAVSTLGTWGIPEEDIQAVRDEAEKVTQRKGKHDPKKDALWARVEVRAPDDGVIVERNVSLHEIVVDNTTNLFQTAKVDRLVVFANVPEDDLPALQALKGTQRRWTVRTVGSPPVKGYIDDIGYLIDPNQHTAVVKGHIDNPGEALRAGQFVTATVDLPAPDGVVEVPLDAVAEDGQQAVVFVQTDPAKGHYTMRRVELTHRFERTAYVRSTPFAKGEERTEDEEPGLLPREPLRPGEHVLRSGVGELKAALLDRESGGAKGRGD
jgi:cobalt-zinc-cadmium efflux system membrane fusion protein